MSIVRIYNKILRVHGSSIIGILEPIDWTERTDDRFRTILEFTNIYESPEDERVSRKNSSGRLPSPKNEERSRDEGGRIGSGNEDLRVHREKHASYEIQIQTSGNNREETKVWNKQRQTIRRKITRTIITTAMTTRTTHSVTRRIWK